MQNNEINIRNTSLYESQPSSVVFTCKTATLCPELQVSMGPSTHLWFCALTTAALWLELIVSMGPRPHLSFCACKPEWLAPELLVSMGAKPHLSFCQCKNNVISIRNTSLYGTLPSSAVFGCQTATLGPELQVSMGSWPHLCFFVFKAATLAPELQVSMGPSPHLWFLHAKQDFWIWIINLYGSQTSPMVLWMQNSVISSRNTSLHGSQTSSEVFQEKQRLLDQNYKSLWVPDLTCRFVHAKQCD